MSNVPRNLSNSTVVILSFLSPLLAVSVHVFMMVTKTVSLVCLSFCLPTCPFTVDLHTAAFFWKACLILLLPVLKINKWLPFAGRLKFNLLRAEALHCRCFCPQGALAVSGVSFLCIVSVVIATTGEEIATDI